MSIELIHTSIADLRAADGTVSFKDAAKVSNIEKYLSGALVAMEGTYTKFGAAAKAQAYAEQADMSAFKADKQHTLEMAQKVEKTLNKAAKEYGPATKIAYALGGSERARALALAAGAVITGVAASQGVDPAAAASLVLGAGAFCTAANSFTPSGKAEEKKDIYEYTQIKHAQIALKKMKKVLTGEPSYKEQVGKLFADGYGNPGGMVTVPSVKDEAKAEEAPKPAAPEKGKMSAYWNEVLKLVAEGYGNPGGMVTVPPSKTGEKTAQPAKASAPKEEKKSSYKEEVANLYASYGNPSGGFVHKAAIDKKRSR